MVYKGKEVSRKDTGKGKRPADIQKTGGCNKRNRGVVQFFENSAYEVADDVEDEEEELSDFNLEDWDFYEDEFDAEPSMTNNEPGKATRVPIFSDEELSERELEKMVEEHYGPSSKYVTYADNGLNPRIPVDGDKSLPSYKEPTVWRVKCMMGREKLSVFCLTQKYVEFNSLGNKLQITSAFFIEHVKGFIFIEAERETDINEAFKGISTVYSSRVTPIPKNEVSRAFSVRSKKFEVSLGSWARVKNGKYKGDLAQIITVNDSRKRATVKLIPRIDLQMLTEKYGGGVRSKKNVVPPPKFVTSTQLEEFRPLIQCRRDRESGLAFEVLDGMMFKDGYLYKKVFIDSLSLYGVLPSETELLKFEMSKNEDPDCQEWLAQLYGEEMKEPDVVKNDKVNDGEGLSNYSTETSFEIGSLVLFNWKDFGVIVGLEKDEYYKILKENSEGLVVLTVDVHQLKKASFEKSFTALDKSKKMISVNDLVCILEGPLKSRQGIVKHIYRGIIFLHDEVGQENNGYVCCKSQICEKLKFSDAASKGKNSESSLSPKSSTAPVKPWKPRGRNNSFNKEDQQQGFIVGQSLRIRVGPLKGYLCRCLAIRRTTVSVKLDSQPKILTVKSEHLAEMCVKITAKPARSSWPDFPSADTPAQPKSNSAMEIDNIDENGSGWRSKETPKPRSTWKNTSIVKKIVVTNEQARGRENGRGVWGNKPKPPTTYHGGSSLNSQGNWSSYSNTLSSRNANIAREQKDYSRNNGPFHSFLGGSSPNVRGNWGLNSNTAPSNHVNPTLGAPWVKTVETPHAGQGVSWGNNNIKNDNSAQAWVKTIEFSYGNLGKSRGRSGLRGGGRGGKDGQGGERRGRGGRGERPYGKEEQGGFMGGRKGRGGTDRGGFRGRGRSVKGAGGRFGGQGRGRSDESSDWGSKQNCGGGDGGKNWGSSGSGGGWRGGNRGRSGGRANRGGRSSGQQG